MSVRAIKSYTPIAGVYNIDNVATKYSGSEDIYLDNQVADEMSYLTLNPNWRTLLSDFNVTATGSVTKIVNGIKHVTTKDIYGKEIYSKKAKWIECVLKCATGSAETLPTGSVVEIKIINTAGATVETKTHTFGAITASNNEKIIFKADSFLLDSEFSMEVKITYPDPTSTEYDATFDVTIDDEKDDFQGALFTIGASAAATNPIVTNVQLIDNDGSEVVGRGLVECFLITDPDTIAAAQTAFDVSTNGAKVVDFLAEQSFLALSEDSGELDLTITKAAAGALRIGVKLPNGKYAISDEIIWTA